jgi:hypothetical protein
MLAVGGYASCRRSNAALTLCERWPPGGVPGAQTRAAGWREMGFANFVASSKVWLFH